MMVEIELIKGKVAILDLKPGDIIVLTVDIILPEEVSKKITFDVATHLPGHKVLLFDGGIGLTILREEPEPIP